MQPGRRKKHTRLVEGAKAQAKERDERFWSSWTEARAALPMRVPLPADTIPAADKLSALRLRIRARAAAESR